MVRISELSAGNPPQGNWLMGVLSLKGYLDDSGSPADPGCNACCIAGYIGTVDDWERFETAWGAALDKHGAPYLHVKEFNDKSSPLFAFRDEEKRRPLLTDLAKAIGEAELWAVSTVISTRCLQRFNQERGRHLDIRALAIFGCMLEIYRMYQGDPIEIKVDRFDKASKTIGLAEEYAGSHYSDDVSQNLDISRSSRSGNDFRPMQAADFVAYEVKKHFENNREWFVEVAPCLTYDDGTYAGALKKWLAARGREYPGWRKSLGALWNSAPVTGGVWDYETLCHLDDIRNGVWTHEAAARRDRREAIS